MISEEDKQEIKDIVKEVILSTGIGITKLERMKFTSSSDNDLIYWWNNGKSKALSLDILKKILANINQVNYNGIPINTKKETILNFIGEGVNVETNDGVIVVSITGGGGGSGTYTNENLIEESLGGIEIGESFTDVPISTMFDKLLYPYQYPSFVSFNISGQAQSLEVGIVISNGNKTFNWSTNNSSNINTNSIVISTQDITNLPNYITLGTGLSNDNSEILNIPNNINYNTPSTHLFKILGINNKSQNFIGLFPVNWYYKVFFGTSSMTEADETEIFTFSNQLSSNIYGNYSITNNGYKYIIIESGFTINSIKDSDTLLNVDMAGTSEGYTLGSTIKYKNISLVRNGLTLDYKMYRSKYIINGTLDIIVS